MNVSTIEVDAVEVDMSMLSRRASDTSMVVERRGRQSKREREERRARNRMVRSHRLWRSWHDERGEVGIVSSSPCGWAARGRTASRVSEVFINSYGDERGSGSRLCVEGS